MTDASTRIWAWPHFDGWITGDWSANTYHDERTVAYILVSEHDRLMAEKDAEIERLREALTPSAETKAAYWSEVECDCPTETWRHYVPWTSIKQIMKMIRARAAVERPEPEEPGGHWATRDNEPDSRTDPDAHRDWQRDRDAQREEGTW